MNLAQAYSLCNSKSGYSRSDGEIYGALSRAGFRVYSAVLKETRGYFLKVDETSLTLVPGTTEYTLPSDLTQIVHLAERISATEDWSPMYPLDLGTALEDIQNQVGWDTDLYGENSEFGFYGPYLDATATKLTQSLQIQKIRVSPGIDQSRFCQIAYTAKWLPINDASSKVMLPDEGTYAMESFASAELCAMNDDTRSQMYEGKGITDLNSFLSWVRMRQTQPLMRETYGP